MRSNYLSMLMILRFLLNVQSFNIILETCKTFHVFSSLNLNEIKSDCLLGIAKHNKEMPIDCNWKVLVHNKLKFLGLYYNYGQRLVNEYNFINSMGLSKILYISTMVKIPQQ